MQEKRFIQSNGTITTTSQIIEFYQSDFLPGILAHDQWRRLALREIKAAYRRSYLGIIWIGLSMAITIVALSIIYTFLFPTTLSEYMPFLAVSYVTWNLIALSLTSSCNVFIKNAAYLKQRSMSLTLFIVSNISTNIFIFLNQFLISVVIVLIFDFSVSYSLLFLPIGLFIIAWTAFAVSMILAPLTCRFRDVAQIVNSITQLAFFVTPILWKPEFLSGRFYIAAVNPFYHYIELIRSPIIDHKVPLMSLTVTLSISAVLTIIGFWVLAKNRRSIPFWV